MWSRSSLPMKRKLAIVSAYISSKLTYAVASAWLWKGDLRRLDGFHANCLRKMLGIKAAFWSRISNERVRQIAGVQALSKHIRKAQLHFFGRILIDPCKQLLRDVAFHECSHVPVTSAFIRRVGRPRQTWTDQLLQIVRSHTGDGLDAALASEHTWRETVAQIMGE